MKTASDLNFEEVCEIVDQIQKALFWNFRQDRWATPDEEGPSGADFIDDVSKVLSDYELAPDLPAEEI